VRKYKERVKMFEEAEREVSKRYSALEDDIDAELEDVVIAREEKLKYENLLEYVEDIPHYVEPLAMNKQM
jgi:heme oxygenase